MLVIGLDGEAHKMNIKSRTCDDGGKSKIHLAARALIKEIYPYDTIREEVTLPGTKTQFNKLNLIADFFLPMRSIIVEVQGAQHSKFNSHFYKNKMSFLKAKSRDNIKRMWCELNSFKLIELCYNEDIDVWRSKF
jgi:hypothetical protein